MGQSTGGDPSQSGPITKSFRILLLEGIHPVAKEHLESEGFRVRLETHSPGERELLELLKEADAVGIRSKTQLNRTILEQSRHLHVIGTFCIGTDQVSC